MPSLSSERKKENEKRAFNAFKKHYPDFPNGTDAHIDEPDFVIYSQSGSKIGVEVTEAIISEEDLRQMKFQHDIGDMVLSKLSLALPFRFGLNVTLYKDTELTKKEKGTLVVELVKLCTDECSQLKDHNRYKVYDFGGNIDEYPDWIKKMIWNDGYRVLPKGVKSISISRYDSAGDSWNEGGYGMAVPRFTKERIEMIVDKKEEKIISYQKKCDKCWLLIWEGGGPSSYYHGIETHPELKTNFGRIFLVRLHNNEVIRIK